MTRAEQHCLELRRAVADGISLAEARKRIAHDRWLASQNALAAAREGRSRHQPAAPVDRPQHWWMRD